MLVARGATAEYAPRIGGKSDSRPGKFFESTLAPLLAVTVHPSSILRAPDSAARRQVRADFVKDLKTFARKLGRKT
jgi:DNA polymerase